MYDYYFWDLLLESFHSASMIKIELHKYNNNIGVSIGDPVASLAKPAPYLMFNKTIFIH